MNHVMSTELKTTTEQSETVDLRTGEVLPAPPNITAVAEQLVAAARGQGIELTGPNGLLTGLTRQVLQSALEAELTEHLGYDPGDRVGKQTPNSRNGSTPKTVRTEIGDLTIQVPRDRAGTFAPVVVPKHQRRIAGFDEAVISLYAKGMTTGDIAKHLSDLYGSDVSRDLVSTVTDKVLGDMQEWQARPLDVVYPVVLIDALVIKVRDGQVANRPVYVAVGIDLEGHRDVLGLWMGPTGGEGAKQWMNMLTELRNRGVADVCIVCCDGLKGLPDAITAIWPLATVQQCVVHLVRNSLRYASKKYWSKITGQPPRGLYRSDHRSGRGEIRGVRRAMAEPVSGDDPDVGERVGRVRAVPEVPARDQTPHLYDQWDRVAQCQVPAGHETPRALPQRAGGDEGALPDGARAAPESHEPDRADRRLESYPEYSVHHLRRPPRNQLSRSPIHKGTDRPRGGR